VTLTTRKYVYTSFRSVLGCRTCMCKRGINFRLCQANGKITRITD